MILTAQAVFALTAADPFWKSKEKVYERVQNGEIIVAVKTEAQDKLRPKHRMTILGGGQVIAPEAFVFKQATNFEDISKVSGYIKSAKFDAPTGLLELVVGAFGFEGQMKLKMKPNESASPKTLGFEVVSGALQGLRGQFDFNVLAASKTEVGINSEFHYDQFPAPQIFLEFGLEVVFQRMAARLKAHVEEEYRKRNGGRS